MLAVALPVANLLMNIVFPFWKERCKHGVFSWELKWAIKIIKSL
jgi:hypothetical protein